MTRPEGTGLGQRITYLGYVRGGGRSWLVDAGESRLLAAHFAAVPVLVLVVWYVRQ